MDRRRKCIDLTGVAVICATLGGALALMLADAFALSASVGAVLWGCALAAAILAIGGWSRAGAALALVLGGGALTILCFPPTNLPGKIIGLAGALSRMGGGELALSEYAGFLGVLMGVLFTMILFWMARMGGGVYPALTLSVILMMGAWLLAGQIRPSYALMAIAALAAMFARASDEKISYLRAVPAAVLAAALAVWLVPAGNLTWTPLYEAAQKARELFNDYFLFTDPRTTYSISADGFQSKGELLGGPAQPSANQVMLVETDRTLLMRGSVKRTYTTYSWTESAINSRYVFIDPTRRAVRDQVFDSARLDGLDITGAFELVQSDVTMLSEGISTLFVPHRIIDYEAPLDLVTYFSSSGEVFITRGVLPGDHYALGALIPTGDVARTRALLLTAARRGDSGYEAARSAYTALPQGIEQGVYELVQRLVQDVSNPYDRALALQNYLLNNFQYSLDVPYPPQGRDFVSYFLLESKTGYCSYFASAMAVMARMAGLPSRYVEGYLVPARADGATVVTGKNAHAWAEIYFEGAGWLSFNPTPGSGDTYQPPTGGGEAGQSAADPGDEPAAGDAEPTPEPTQQPDGAGAPDEPQPQDESEDAPQDEPQDEPEDPPPEENDPDPPAEAPPNPWWWLLAPLVLAALALFVVRRLRGSDPRALTRGRKGAADKLAIWYRAMLLALEQQGQTPGPGETPEQFAQRLKQANLAGDAFVETARQLSLNRYARRKVDAAALAQAGAAYDLLARQLKPVERLRWLWQRIAHGLGSAQQIP